MPDLGRLYEALTFPVKRLEGLHKVSESPCIGFIAHGFVDWQDLLELVLLLTCKIPLTVL